MSKETLYIIGNGFDIYHNLPTKFSDFLEYIKIKDSELFGYLEQYFSGDLWSDFENALSTLDITKILSDAENLFPSNEESDKWSDIYIIEDYAEQIKHILTSGLVDSLIDWILEIEYPNNGNFLDIDKKATFLSFNYTDTLEQFYNIESSRITYIHNKAPKYFFKDGYRDYFSDEIIIGHSVDEKKEKPKPYSKGVKIAIAYQEAFEHLKQYFVQSYKNTAKVISDNQKFFANLTYFEEIVIIGHSLSDIDIAYFQEISKKAINVKEWKITYHGDEKLSEMKTQALKFLHRLDNVCFFNSKKEMSLVSCHPKNDSTVDNEARN